MKLNIGSNDKRVEGFENVDIVPGPNVDIVASAHDLHMIKDESVEEILAEHILEHLTFYQANLALAEWYRVLTFNGKLFIEVPDLLRICEAFIEGNEYQRFQNNIGYWSLSHQIFGNQRGRNHEENLAQTHKSGYTLDRLFSMLYGFDFAFVKEIGPVKQPKGSYVIRVEASK